MRFFFFVLIAVLTTAHVARPLSQSKSGETAKEVLQKLLEKVNSYERISYNYYRSINYFSESYHSETSGTTFFDFKSSDTTLGFRYQLENEQYNMVYNGAEAFHLNKKEKTIKIYYKPKHRDFASLSLLANSIVTLKRALPAIIEDNEIVKTLTDTSIGNKSYYLASFVLQNKTLSGLGSFDMTTIKRTFFYKIVVDKASYLPLHVIQTNDGEPKDYMLTSFTEFKSNPSIPSELSWYYSTYLNDYKPASQKKLTLIHPNTMALAWQLSFFNSDDSIQLSNLKGNVVLLEFWIKNCGYCIAAVPKLNALLERYKGKKLQVIGINTHDTKDDINNFYKKNQPKFKTVYDNNGKVTTDYGVEAFPTVVLIDKNGVVLYAGSFDQEQLEGLLKASFK